MAMAYLAAITAASGVPLFVRTKGDVPPLPYPKLASLNGAHFFASSLESELQSCCSGGAKTVWKCFHDSITLILVSSDDEGSCDGHMTYLLELVFSAMVLVLGLQELDAVQNVERLKRDLKCCFPLIDHILEQNSLLSPLTRCVDVIACDDTAILQDTLEVFAESAQSSYGCLLINNRICVATQSWWELSALETSLLSLFLSSLPHSTAKDIPVFLPRASNKTPHRLLAFSLLEGVELCLLCDSTPPLVNIEITIESYWRGVIEILKSCCYVYPRCFPGSVTFDPSVLGLCLVNMESGRCLSTLTPSTGTESRVTLSAGFRGDVSADKKYGFLARFYKTVVDQFLPSPSEAKEKASEVAHSGEEAPALRDNLPHKICETYSCTARYKAYGLHRDKYLFIVLFSPSLPTFALRKVTDESLQKILTSHLTAFSIIR